MRQTTARLLEALPAPVAPAVERVFNHAYFYGTGPRRAVRRVAGGRPRTTTQRRYGLSSPEAFVLHCPAPQRIPSNPFRHVWSRACERFFADETLRGRFGDPDDLTIVTYNTEPEPGLLERCLDHLGLRRYVVLGRGVHDWSWRCKVTLVLDWLDSGLCATRHVMCLDGDDVLVVDDPALALRRLRESGCRILFGGTRGNQPVSPECWDFENSIDEYRDPRHRHLNAGAYVGETAAVQARLREIADAAATQEAWCFSRYGFDDQLAWRHLHRRLYPELKVDAGCRVFVRFDEDR